MSGDVESWAHNHARENPGHQAREGLDDPGSCHDCAERSPIYSLTEKDAGRRDLPCPVCNGKSSHHAVCSVPVLGIPSRCTCSPTEVENGTCALCGKPFPTGDSV